MKEFAIRIVEKIEERAMHVVIEPDDMTRYKFLISDIKGPFDAGNLRIASVNGPKFVGYIYRKNSIRQFAMKHAGQCHDTHFKELSEDPYIGYMIGHSDCNPWTAVAAIMAADSVLNVWEKSQVGVLEI